jgi:hypothetical protein
VATDRNQYSSQLVYVCGRVLGLSRKEDSNRIKWPNLVSKFILKVKKTSIYRLESAIKVFEMIWWPSRQSSNCSDVGNCICQKVARFSIAFKYLNTKKSIAFPRDSRMCGNLSGLMENAPQKKNSVQEEPSNSCCMYLLRCTF